MKRNHENSNFAFYKICGVGVRRHFTENRHFQRLSKKNKIVATVIFFLFSLFLILLIFSARTNAPFFSGISSLRSSIISFTNGNKPPLLWEQGNPMKTCDGRNYPTAHIPNSLNKSSTCPSYFQWIYEDLKPWKHTGITKDMVKAAKKWAHFKVVIVDGKAYVERLKKSIQSRDMFSLWGILQLLRYYPGKLPDLELYMDCGDRPVVKGRKKAGAPAVFGYCSDALSLDIVFPDWSFWGWAECNIKEWGSVLAEIKEGNKKTKWEERVAYAYWRGNPYVAPTRRDLLTCNLSRWSTRLYIQNWEDEITQGFKHSSLGDQCTHRYKIYTEGWAWSVSEKYILACDSMTLYIRSQYHDFFIRAMEPLKHYWPIQPNSKCSSLKYAVDWGNNNTHKAQAIGEAASRFMQQDMKMEYVYDYMFHLLNEYGKLFKYKPTVPAGAIELCPETMVSPVKGTARDFMEESLVKSPSETSPCNLPPYNSKLVSDSVQRKETSFRQVETWEKEYWANQNIKH